MKPRVSVPTDLGFEPFELLSRLVANRVPIWADCEFCGDLTYHTLFRADPVRPEAPLAVQCHVCSLVYLTIAPALYATFQGPFVQELYR